MCHKVLLQTHIRVEGSEDSYKNRPGNGTNLQHALQTVCFIFKKQHDTKQSSTFFKTQMQHELCIYRMKSVDFWKKTTTELIHTGFFFSFVSVKGVADVSSLTRTLWLICIWGRWVVYHHPRELNFHLSGECILASSCQQGAAEKHGETTDVWSWPLNWGVPRTLKQCWFYRMYVLLCIKDLWWKPNIFLSINFSKSSFFDWDGCWKKRFHRLFIYVSKWHLPIGFKRELLLCRH